MDLGILCHSSHILIRMKTTEQTIKPSDNRFIATYPSSFVATVEWVRGNRLMSTVMRNAGLGLSGVGVKERVNISYKPGEIVTEERVMKAVQSMIDQSNAENAEFEISCPRVVRIFETNNLPTNNKP
jgi:hypothetical protein